MLCLSRYVCEPLNRFFRQKSWWTTLGCVCSLLGACRAQATLPEEIALQALQAWNRGTVKQAVQRLKVAFAQNPGDPELLDIYGAMVLCANRFEEAKALFGAALQKDPQDPVALYGSGLLHLARGESARALQDFSLAEAAGGDRTVLETAKLYAQWPKDTSRQPAMPTEEEQNAILAMKGMADYRLGAVKEAQAELKALMKRLPEQGLVNPPAPLMTFHPNHPLNGEVELPIAFHTPAMQNEKGVRGVVTLRPEVVAPNVAYVGYDIDGKPLALVGDPPYSFSWDTRTVPNGLHRVALSLYDANSNLLDRGERIVHVINGFSCHTGPAQERLRAAFWGTFGLQPDASACAEALGMLAQSAGERAEARLWFTWAAATQPSAGIRAKLAAYEALDPKVPICWAVQTSQKVIALTFDDGPKPGVTEALLDTLKRLGVKATFFVIGQHVMQYPDLTRQIAKAGMELANHSFTHPNLKTLSPQAIAQQLMATQAAVEWATGQVPRFLRPPGGDENEKVEKIAHAWGLTLCMWTIDAYDAELVGSMEAAEHVARAVRPGAIVLMHNGKMSTVQALPSLVRTLQRRGYTFVTLSQLLQMGRSQTTPIHLQRGE
ncbi:predicted xylanase/chitin deacetylase [Chthonomonas calidirosea]|uniref:Predicted xylanase/chitin deacetylase n=1 Tax=Chthonomonas calidirosea (strain DSM 23976 / ICMP 18418 / T49) TaxID=1303518 RepID=S0EV83_CHTCT|nr:Predicted xylanase/chitin deacetylase [Chthonomonas calidirosea T49]CEK19563.1 predicted xylanase/chitin deacetylase [Chthonomonas calidirosea]